MIAERRPKRPHIALAVCMLAALTTSACQSDSPAAAHPERVKSDPKERFTESQYGVKASPRVTDLKKVPKGGGREQTGRPYKVRGKWYYPKEQLGYSKVGHASWYGSSFHGRLTANGEVYDMFGLSAAHPTFPLPSYARVTNMANGSNVIVRVNDRGPYVDDRMMDLSSAAAEMLGYKADGVGEVKLEYLGKAPLEGDDTPMLMASYKPGNVAPSANDGLPSGVMLAMNEARRPNYSAALRDGALPGVKSSASAIGEQTTIDAIIGQEMQRTSVRAKVPKPRPRTLSSDLVVASYAADNRAPAKGAAAALGALARPVEVAARIEIGAIEDEELLASIRQATNGHGRLVADSQGGTSAYSLVLSAGEDADAMLRQLWQLGANNAFALRD